MTDAVQPGDILVGKYRVERMLGAGGMGIVVLATHVHLEQLVAIKLLLPDALQNEEAVRRFVQEARAAARIRGEHVVRVHDVGTLEDGRPYLVMEYLEGQDLSELLETRGRLNVSEAVDYVLQACEAIAEAHKAGIIHRDLKPANLFLHRGPDGTRGIKVLDFGISKIAPKPGTDPNAAMTKTRALMGSPLYMSPEQMRSTRTVTTKADIWALGVILYELLSGTMPFSGETMPEICAMVLTEPFPSIQTVNPDVPPELDAVLARCAEKDPTARFDIAGLAEALGPFASTQGQMSVSRVSRVVSGGSVPPPSQVATSLRHAPSDIRPSALAAPASHGVEAMVSARGPSPSAVDVDLGSAGTRARSTSPPLGAATAATFGTTAPAPASRARSWLAAGGAVAVVIAVVVVAAMRGEGKSSTASSSTPASTSVAPPPSSPTAAPPGQSASPDPSPAPSPATAVAAPVDSARAPVPTPTSAAVVHSPSKVRTPAPKPTTVKPQAASTAGFGHGLD